MNTDLSAPFRGGRRFAAAGVPGDPTTYDFGTTEGRSAKAVFAGGSALDANLA